MTVSILVRKRVSFSFCQKLLVIVTDEIKFPPTAPLGPTPENRLCFPGLGALIILSYSQPAPVPDCYEYGVVESVPCNHVLTPVVR